jgi:hypothetical protein
MLRYAMLCYAMLCYAMLCYEARAHERRIEELIDGWSVPASAVTHLNDAALVASTRQRAATQPSPRRAAARS